MWCSGAGCGRCISAVGQFLSLLISAGTRLYSYYRSLLALAIRVRDTIRQGEGKGIKASYRIYGFWGIKKTICVSKLSTIGAYVWLSPSERIRLVST